MNSSITVLNSTHTEFNFGQIHLNTNYNIILHCVYDLDNQFEELNFLKDCTKQDLVILWHPVEMGVWNSSWMLKLDHIVANSEFKLIYLTGCSNRLNINDFLPHKFNLQFLPVFDLRAKDMFKIPKSIKIDKNKKFIFLNSKDSAHRRYVLGNLIKNNLIEQGTVSYQCSEGLTDPSMSFYQGVNFTEQQLKNVSELFKLTEIRIPMVLDGNTAASQLPRNLLLDSYINIVGETSFINVPYTFSTSFVTEKTFSAIANNQMFIIVGHAGSLRLLRDLGYKTFNGIIDESYDNILNNGQRLEAVTNEIVRFLSQPIDKIKEDYIQVLDIIEHNKNVLFSSSSLENRLQNIIDSL